MAQYKKLSSFGKTNDLKDSAESADSGFIDVFSIKSIEEKKMLIENNKICVFDIYGDWCGPCKIVSPLFVELSKKYNISGVCFLAKENVDLRLSPNIQVVPTFEFYLNGKLSVIITGADVNAVEEKIIELLESPETKETIQTKQIPPQELPPQMQPQFQYQQDKSKQAPPKMPMEQAEQFIPKQSSNEGYQHLNQSRQEYYEKPANLPMPLPIRRKI